MYEPKVTIIIINWNGLRDTIECIESLKKIEYANYDILVVDNGSSSDDSSQLKQQFEGIKVIELKKNLGFANANNVGILLAINKGAEYVLLLNNDTVVHPKFLQEMMCVAVSDNKIGILGSKIYLYDQKDRFWYAGGKLNMYFGHSTEGQHQSEAGQYNAIKKTDWVSGACMLIRKEIFNSIGLLPREYFLSWEDIDFCLAARKKGFSCVFVPDSQIWHKASASFKRHNLDHKQVFYGFRNRIIMRKKFLSKSEYALFLVVQSCIMVPVYTVYYMLVYKDMKRLSSMFKGLSAGIRDAGKRTILYQPI